MRKQYLKVVSLVMVGMLATGMLLDFNVGKASDTEGGGTPQTVTESGTATQDAGATQDGGEGTTTEPVVEATEEEKNPVWGDRDFGARKEEDGVIITRVNTYKLDRVREKMEIFTIPETFRGRPVYGIDEFVFYKCGIKGKVVLPKGIKSIGMNAFSNDDSNHNRTSTINENNAITEVFIPNTVQGIEFSSFSKIPTLKKVEFEKGGTKNLAIMEYAFSGASIENLDLPERTLLISRQAFRNNKFKEINLPKTGLLSLGEYAFQNTPLETVENLRVNNSFLSSGLAEFTYADTELKNISFKNYYADDASEEKEPSSKFLVKKDEESGLNYIQSPSEKKYLGKSLFKNANLKSIEIPDNITLEDRLNVDSEENPFYNNTGWMNGDSRVALYRLDKAGNYVTDGKFSDGFYHVVNPVRVVVKAVDQDGNEIALKEGEILSLLETKNNRNQTEVATPDVNTNGNISDFKVGDRFTFELPKLGDYEVLGVVGNGFTEVKKPGPTPDTESVLGAEVVPPVSALNTVSAMADDKGTGRFFTVDLTKDNINEVSYGDGYKVGYRELEIKLQYKVPKISPIAPEINEGFVEPQVEPKEEPKTDPTPQPPVEPASTVNENIIPPLVEIIESSEEEEPEINLVPVVTEPVAVSDIEEISFDEDLTPRSDADLEEEGLEILGDDVPQGRKDFTNGKRNKDMKGLLAKTGGLHTVFYQLAAGLGLILLTSILVELYRKRKLSK